MDYDTWLTTVPNEGYCSRHDLIYTGEHDCEDYEADLTERAAAQAEADAHDATIDGRRWK